MVEVAGMPQSGGNSLPDPNALIAEAEALGARLAGVREAIARVIFGQEEVVEQTLITLLSGGHGLLVGVPGLGKTRLVETLGTVLGLDARRVQFTPDLMPADIIGSEVLEESEGGRRAFRFLPGPVFCQLLMADEINRASPRTQSALLQAMQEHQVAVAGVSHPLPAPFHVLATQNPIEQEGTYPILKLVRGARPAESVLPTVSKHLAWGPGPRAAQALMLATRARAVLDGRLAPSVEDVLELAEPVLRHRMALNFAARAEGVRLADVIAALKAQLG